MTSWELGAWELGQGAGSGTIGCYISGITLVSSDVTTDATDHPGLAARENEE
jgi:hypothetical protein